jgi:hypothetical protein
MKKILEFEDYLEADLELDEAQKAMLKNWVKKYEKYFNFHNSGSFIDSIDDITKDAVEQLGIDKSKSDAVKDYLESLYDLSDGISVIMAPGMEFQYTNIDQVQRFQY